MQSKGNQYWIGFPISANGAMLSLYWPVVKTSNKSKTTGTAGAMLGTVPQKTLNTRAAVFNND